MMGALAFIPEYSRQRYLNRNLEGLNSSNCPYFELFNHNALEELWKELV